MSRGSSFRWRVIASQRSGCHDCLFLSCVMFVGGSLIVTMLAPGPHTQPNYRSTRGIPAQLTTLCSSLKVRLHARNRRESRLSTHIPNPLLLPFPSQGHASATPPNLEGGSAKTVSSAGSNRMQIPGDNVLLPQCHSPVLPHTMA